MKLKAKPVQFSYNTRSHISLWIKSGSLVVLKTTQKLITVYLHPIPHKKWHTTEKVTSISCCCKKNFIISNFNLHCVVPVTIQGTKQVPFT